MPGLEDILGKEKQQKQINPLEATPQSQVAEPDENPLEKMDEISKRKDSKNKSDSKSLDPKTLEDMLMTGENTSGMFEPEVKEPKGNEPKLNEEVDEDAKRHLDKGKVEPSEKYAKNFKNDIMKHPNDYKVDTPEGEMTIAEAIKRGYNPITKRFEARHNQENIKNSFLGELNDADRTNIERITNPSAAQIAPADAEKYGLDANSPMIRPNQGASPLPGMPQGGVPTSTEQGMVPPQQGVPGAEATPQAGNPLESLLGGNQ